MRKEPKYDYHVVMAIDTADLSEVFRAEKRYHIHEGILNPLKSDPQILDVLTLLGRGYAGTHKFL